MGIGKYFFGGVLLYFIVMTFAAQIQAQPVSNQAAQAQNLPSTQLDAGIQKLLDNSWAINNQGKNQLFDLDLMQAYRLQGRVGQDLQLPKDPSNKVTFKLSTWYPAKGPVFIASLKPFSTDGI